MNNLACIFIVLCPILDMVSFIYRNLFNTSYSPSTFLRPIIPIILGITMFIKCKEKVKLSLIATIYLVYGIIHLFFFTKLQTLLSYSNVMHEFQYITNYTFMILNLIVYLWIFKKDDTKLRKSLVISSYIYIISIYIAILTKTSSPTYIEGLGYKGWFESGNSISAILTLSLFVIISLVKEKKYRIPVILLVSLIGVYLTIFIGTRVRTIWIYFSITYIYSIRNFYSYNKKEQN